MRSIVVALVKKHHEPHEHFSPIFLPNVFKTGKKYLSFKGNTMGYVRMIKAGGLHFVSNSIRFVPDLDDIPNFEELTLKEEVGGLGAGNNKDTMASEAAKTLDEVVANLGKNFSDNTEYFQVCLFFANRFPSIFATA